MEPIIITQSYGGVFVCALVCIPIWYGRGVGGGSIRSCVHEGGFFFFFPFNIPILFGYVSARPPAVFFFFPYRPVVRSERLVFLPHSAHHRVGAVVSMSSRCLPADHITDVIQLLLPDRRNQIWKNRLKIEYRDETVSLWFRLHSSSSSSSCPVSFFRFGNSRCRPLRVSCVRNHLLLSRQKCNCPAGDLERKERD